MIQYFPTISLLDPFRSMVTSLIELSTFSLCNCEPWMGKLSLQALHRTFNTLNNADIILFIRNLIAQEHPILRQGLATGA